MGAHYYELLADRTALLLQLQGFAACGDDDVREAIRSPLARLRDAVANVTHLEPVTVKTFLAFGMLLNAAAAMDAEDVNGPWAQGSARESTQGFSSTSRRTRTGKQRPFTAIAKDRLRSGSVNNLLPSNS